LVCISACISKLFEGDFVEIYTLILY